jgi:regulator of sirC expression with transglutaminase-like and TPR domain
MAVDVVAGIEAGKSKNIHPEFKFIRELLVQSEGKIDLFHARFLIENYLDSGVNVEENINIINNMVEAVKKVPFYSDTVEGKLNGLVQYLYMPGKWNNNKAYQYDFDNPLSLEKPENSYLSNYLKTKVGNCVSMPLLVLALGERLGLNMSLAAAPNHLFVQLKDSDHHFNFEATAGGLKARNSYITEFDITAQAIRSGIYLKSLTKKQTLVVMLSELALLYSEKSQKDEDFEKAFELTSLMLEHDPQNVQAMLIRGNIWRNILHRDVKTFENMKIGMTDPIKKHFEGLLMRNLKWYEKAESLGWQEPPEDYNEKYLKMVSEVRKFYE